MIDFSIFQQNELYVNRKHINESLINQLLLYLNTDMSCKNNSMKNTWKSKENGTFFLQTSSKEKQKEFGTNFSIFYISWKNCAMRKLYETKQNKFSFTIIISFHPFFYRISILRMEKKKKETVNIHNTKERSLKLLNTWPLN